MNTWLFELNRALFRTETTLKALNIQSRTIHAVPSWVQSLCDFLSYFFIVRISTFSASHNKHVHSLSRAGPEGQRHLKEWLLNEGENLFYCGTGGSGAVLTDCIYTTRALIKRCNWQEQENTSGLLFLLLDSNFLELKIDFPPLNQTCAEIENSCCGFVVCEKTILK